MKLSIFDFNQQLQDRWVIRHLSLLPPGINILDAGAGEGRYRPYCHHLHYVAQDVADYHGQGNATGLQTGTWNYTPLDIISDITHLPIRAKAFSAVLCTEVLEHLPFPEAAIGELSRVLKPGGWLILTAPFCSLTHFAPFHYATGFNRYWYEKILPQYHFRLIEISPRGNAYSYTIQELLRLPWMVHHYSFLKYLPFLLYVFILPLVVLVWLLSLFSRSSSDQLCFGYHVLAQKESR